MKKFQIRMTIRFRCHNNNVKISKSQFRNVKRFKAIYFQSDANLERTDMTLDEFIFSIILELEL